jgi:predicted O-methyltransferase YrrM
MKAIALSEPLYEYIVERFAVPERTLLRRMKARADKAGLPPIMISEEQAKFVSLLVRLHGRVKRVLDVGTLFGFSAAVLAQAMGTKGRVVSLEAEPRNAKVARANLEELGLQDRVEVREGLALELMRGMQKESFDLVLVDADKENYSNYLEEAVRLLRDGGIVLVDNAFAFGRVLEAKPIGPSSEDVRAVRSFNDALSKRKDVDAVLVPVGDGLAFGLVRKS